jgi:hypothetical protein
MEDGKTSVSATIFHLPFTICHLHSGRRFSAACQTMTPAAWLEAACADAERRGLPELKPLLETLARSLAALREHERVVLAETGPPAASRPL